MDERGGLPLRERLLSDPDALGRAASTVAPVANFVNTLPLARWVMERTVGVAAKKDLPRFVWQTFTRWFETRETPKRTEPPAARVVLFPTCSVEWNRPEIGRAAVAVLERNGVEVAVAYPQCCGMPLFDVGDVAGADEARHTFVSAGKGWVAKGHTIVPPGPRLPPGQEGVPVARGGAARPNRRAHREEDARPVQPRGLKAKGSVDFPVPEVRRVPPAIYRVRWLGRAPPAATGAT